MELYCAANPSIACNADGQLGQPSKTNISASTGCATEAGRFGGLVVCGIDVSGIIVGGPVHAMVVRVVRLADGATVVVTGRVGII